MQRRLYIYIIKQDSHILMLRIATQTAGLIRLTFFVYTHGKSGGGGGGVKG